MLQWNFLLNIFKLNVFLFNSIVFSRTDSTIHAMNTFLTGMLLSLSLILAIGPQNAHVLRMGLLRRHVGITVAACAVTDLLLILIGVFGLAELGKLSAWVTQLLVAGAIGFLLVYGWQGAQRFWRSWQLARKGADQAAGLQAQADSHPLSAGRALATALAFSWLNPHAWIDTAVLIGSASTAFASPQNLIFGLGAAAGSALWFISLGFGAAALAHKLAKPAFWRAIDLAVAVTMWTTAAVLAWSLVKPPT
jgi:L-lysine exporter family protein LysE/ArgO